MSNEYSDWLDDEIIQYAEDKHNGQVRKYTNEPYFNHPLRVSSIISEICSDIQRNNKIFIDTNIIKILKNTAILHDTVEDTDASFVEIEEKFGIKIRNLVFWLTNISKPEMGNRCYRKKIDLNHILQAPVQAIIVKIADVMDNCCDIVKRDKEFAKRYLKEKDIFLNAIYKKYKDDFNNLEKITDYDLIFFTIYRCARKLINKELKELENENIS